MSVFSVLYFLDIFCRAFKGVTNATVKTEIGFLLLLLAVVDDGSGGEDGVGNLTF